jgi:hypothetical protein
MQKIFLPSVILGLVGSFAINPIAGKSLHSAGRELRHLTAGSQQVQVTGVQLLFRGQPVGQAIQGKKIKKYSVQVAGTGFQPDSLVVVNSVRAFDQQPGQSQEQPVSTTYVSATSLDAAFLPGPAPAPGLLLIKVVNPNGDQSNIIAADVISKPSKLSIDSISPLSGPIGTQLTLTGEGLEPTGQPSQAAIRFSAVGSHDSALQGFYTSSLVDDSKLLLVVPNNVVRPICPGGPFACDPVSVPQITPQDYRIWVINSNGMSNSILFHVTSD